MPLMLPERLSCRPGNPIIMHWGDARAAQCSTSQGGTVFLGQLHYLHKIENGLAYFNATRKNSMRKQGLVLIVRMQDIIDPDEWRRKALNLFHNGRLTATDTQIHKFAPTDDIRLVDIGVVAWNPPEFT